MTKTDYPNPDDYIKRFVKKIDAQSQFNHKTLSETLKNEKRIVILGVAGLGKSIELERLAFEHSSGQSDLLPVLITLANVTDQEIDEIVKLKFSNFDDYPPNKLLILFDALDEVHTNYIEVVAKKINLFVEKYDQLNIVVSCRNNFYTTEIERGRAKLEKFKSYVLMPINWFSINNYINDKVDGDVQHLIEQFHQRRLYDLFSSPFYLVQIIQYYKENLILPESKRDVFEYLIEKRINQDLDKYQDSGINIEKYTSKINDTLENIAMIMLYSGQNQLTNNQVFGKILTDPSLIKVIEHTFLFNKDNTNNFWSFEHNNFKEYLAARFLSKLSLKRIKEIVSVGSLTKKIKPSWLNTLSLLISVMAFDEKSRKLINWIVKIDPDALIRVEKDKLPLNIRENLFYLFYDDFNQKGVLVRSEKFEQRDLAMMVSDSSEILFSIIQIIDQTNDRITLLNSMQLLGYFDSLNQFLPQIEDALLKKILDFTISDEIKYNVFETLADLKIFSNSLTSKVLGNICLTLDDQHLRTGFYLYLESAPSNALDNYLEIFLEGLLKIKPVKVLVNQKTSDDDIYLSEESFVLQRLFKRLTNLSSLKEIINWAKIQDEDIPDDPFYQIIGDAINRCEKLSEKEKSELVSPLIELMFRFCRIFKENLDDDLIEFFKSLDKPKKHLDLIFSKSLKSKAVSVNEDIACGLVICDKKSLDYVIRCINQGEISDEKIIRLRNALSWKRKTSMFQEFYDFIVQIDLKYEITPQIDYDNVREEQFTRDRELLSSREDFIQEIVNIYEQEKTSQLSEDALFNFKKNRFRDDVMTNTLVVELLRDLAKDDENKIARRNEALNFLECDSNWKGIRFNKLLSWDRSKPEFEFSKDEQELMIGWLEEHLPNCNFKSALKKTEKGYSYARLEAVALYLILRLDYALSDEICLDMLHFDVSVIPTKGKVSSMGDEDSHLIHWIISKTTFEMVKSKISQNIIDRSVVDMVLEKHYKFCAAYKLEMAQVHILKDLKIKTFKSYEESRLVDCFLGCHGQLSLLIPLMRDLDNQTNLHILDIMNKSSSPILISTCVELISHGNDSNVKISYIDKLISYDENIGFTHQMNWILENEIFPDRWYNYKELSFENLTNLLFLFQSALLKGFGKTSWMGNGRNDCFTGLIEFGSSNHEAFKLVGRYINSWLEFAPEEKFLHYQMQKLDQEFYSKKSIAMDFDMAYAEVYSPLRFSVFKYVFHPEKSSVDNFGLKVGIIGIIVTIISVILSIVL